MGDLIRRRFRCREVENGWILMLTKYREVLDSDLAGSSTEFKTRIDDVEEEIIFTNAPAGLLSLQVAIADYVEVEAFRLIKRLVPEEECQPDREWDE